MTTPPPTQRKHTPMMAQWQSCKDAAKEAILLFRMGDFYEAFYEDAELLAKELELTLTKRQEIPMSGVPHHTVETYIDRLIAKGFRVAVAEQTEDPKQAKGLVKREIVRVVTPGTVMNSSLLADKSNNFIVSITRVGSVFGLSLADLSTGEFLATEFENEKDLQNEIYRLGPSEVVTSNKFCNKHAELIKDIRLSQSFLLNSLDDWHFEHESASHLLTDHFKVHNLEGFGLKGMTAAINSAGALLYYLKEQLSLSIDHIQSISTYSTNQFLSLDRTTQRNLELTENLEDGSRKNTLLHVLDRTKTPMGGRLLKRWVKLPLLDPEKITLRQDSVLALINNASSCGDLQKLLDSVRDIERLMMKVCTGHANPRDLVTLSFSLAPLPTVKETLTSFPSPLLTHLSNQIEDLSEVCQKIDQAVREEPPARVSDGHIFRDGYHGELDELRELTRNNKAWLERYQERIREETGIKTVKVGFNRMFGYYIEVSKGQTDRMPDTFQRRQTLVNAERYISPELKEYEQKVLTAEERIAAIESHLFQTLRLEVATYGERVMKTAQAIAQTDCLASLAEVAVTNGYTRPIVDLDLKLEVADGRHPVIESCHSSEAFIANDTLLNDNDHRLLIITGPNMAGKSTYIRQVALITIMAQIGSFVPARAAHIGIVDKVFTRIGASDNLSRGQSTFMVEMTETANILNNATSRSLVILDEIGRGTSTYDGISIAWAVAEFLLSEEDKCARTLFATHYWELTKLESHMKGAVNYNIAVREHDDDIIFLRKIVRGGADKSYGIHVGQLAGLPSSVISRANEILSHLEEQGDKKDIFEPSKRKTKPRPKRVKSDQGEMQLTLFEPKA